MALLGFPMPQPRASLFLGLNSKDNDKPMEQACTEAGLL